MRATITLFVNNTGYASEHIFESRFEKLEYNGVDPHPGCGITLAQQTDLIERLYGQIQDILSYYREHKTLPQLCLKPETCRQQEQDGKESDGQSRSPQS